MLNKLRNIIRKTLSEVYLNRDVLYSAVVIEEPSEIQKIQEFSKNYIPDGWSEPAHYHMTIAHGGLPETLRLRGDLNKDVELTVDMIGISENAIAFGVSGYYSKNDIPHITIAFNKATGAAAADSKKILNWTPIQKLKLSGIIREIGIGNKVLKNDKKIEERDGMNISSTGSVRAYPGIPSQFPEVEDFDEFGNLKK